MPDQGGQPIGEIRTFLDSCPVFHGVPATELDQIAPFFRLERFPAGAVILRQGGYSAAVYFIRSGRLAVRIQRGPWRETVAYLQPPDVFGELSFITGRACVADVEVEVDAEVVLLPKEELPKLPRQGDALVRGLMRAVAERLQQTMIRGMKAPESPVVVLHQGPNWEAPWSFASELACSLARQTGRETLLVNLGAPREQAVRPLGEHAGACDLAAQVDLRSELARRLTTWKGRYDNVVLNPAGPDGPAITGAIGEFGNYHGFLAGPGDEIPPAPASDLYFVVASAARPALGFLSGNRQMIVEAAVSEAAFRSGGQATPAFRRTVDSIARCVAGLQVGLALGGGAAWGWAHIGVLQVLEEAGLPVDMISGCSMGSVIGAFRASGLSIRELETIAEYWRKRTRRFLEWRFWRMSLISEKTVRKVFRQYFGDRPVNRTDIPFWANAVDIQTGKEYTVKDGTLVECVRASIALPGLLPPAAHNSHILVDAGIMDPVPVNLVRQMGCQYAIGVNAMAALESQPIKTRYPFNAFSVMSRCMFLMGHEIGQARAEQAADVLFTPSLAGISMLEFDRSPEIIEQGRQAAEQNLPAILAGYRRLKERE